MSNIIPLQAWSRFRNLTVTPLEGGLINGTWSVGDPPVGVIQSQSPIFSPELNRDIAKITAHLEAKGILTPKLIPTDAGELWHVDSGGTSWRALSWLPGFTHHKLTDTTLAFEAGGVVARWHAALEDLEHRFHFSRPGAHDTAAHMQTMKDAVDREPRHRLAGPVEELASKILEAWESWSGRLNGPETLAHGDLKISNLRFNEKGEAIALLDLDTMGYLSLDIELGDAFRSWCNPAAEDTEETGFDIALFEASARGYLANRRLGSEERSALPGGVERICLELSARFAADAINEAYFGWNPAVAPGRGEHSLLRAKGQFCLAQSVRSQRSKMERVLA
jgi:Ser/Thr protein kinase RdoA (MazF antagonist)